jgi:hypothetical protein
LKRIHRFWTFFPLLTLCAAGLFLAPGCSLSPSASSGATGGLNVMVTDGPADEWQEVTVVVKSISLGLEGSLSWTEVWAADPADPESGKINLLNLNGVAELLGQATLPVGTYSRLKVVIDTNPATIKLVDDMGNTLDSGHIKVVDRGRRGDIRVDLSPPITVVEGETTNLQVDFDLAHPMSIVDIAGNVFIDLRIRHKPLPRRLFHLQFARTIGTVAEKDVSGFTLKTLRGKDVDFNVNGDTIYVDADLRQPGSFDGMAVGKAALVASNMNSDGTLYARRIWYADDVRTLPRFTPEGLVRRGGPDTIHDLHKKNDATTNHRWDWRTFVVTVDENTAWTFRGDIPMGTGTSVLRHIRRGYRVDVRLVDPNATPKVAAAINVHFAHDEGNVTDVSASALTFGWGCDRDRAIPYSAIPEHEFNWWFFALPSASSTSVQDFVDTVNEARLANLWVFARAHLYWDGGIGGWVAEDVILAPEKLREPTKITVGYTPESGSIGVSTFSCCDPAQPVDMTVFLDTEGNLQTVVGSFVANMAMNVHTATIPVPPSEWPALLTPALSWVRIWVRPVKADDGTFSWHAYTVLAYQIVY